MRLESGQRITKTMSAVTSKQVKGINDYVTGVDKAAEAEIIEIIQNLILIIQLSVKSVVH